MSLSSIDPLELGDYMEGSACPWRSRNEAAHQMSFHVNVRGSGLYWVWRAGGDVYSVQVCLAAGVYWAECECHDWTAYGAGFHRACIHIWRVIQTQAVGVC